MKKIKTIIFDFDGIIADTLPFTFKKVIQIARILKPKNLNEKQIIEEIRSKDWKELLGKGGFPQFWLKLPAVLSVIFRMQVELGKEIETIKLFPGIKKLLVDLKKKHYQLGILSSNLKENIDRFIKINGIDYFDFIEAGTYTMLGKSGEIDKFARELKIEKEQMVYVGDEIRDINASKKAGIKIICVSWGLHRPAVLKDHGADFIVKKPSEILKIVENC
ncbi:HAD-IA family hydrolase [Candidatus Roizmanbacteria bacterium]|nr:HAD-IA family hydrolase [Candidatus Roizmanbacteria bacterium]